MSNNDGGDQILSTNESNSTGILEYEQLEELIVNMTQDSNLLKQGYSLISNLEKCKGLYLNFLKIIFTTGMEGKVIKLAASTLKIFLTKNWKDDEYINNEERMVFY
jgi:hypothetical protein